MLNVAQINVTLVCVDEFYAVKTSEPVAFAGDADGTAADKLRAWLDALPGTLAELDKDS